MKELLFIILNINLLFLLNYMLLLVHKFMMKLFGVGDNKEVFGN